MMSSVQRLGRDFGRVWFATGVTALGVLFDRVRRRPLLVAAEAGRAAVLLTLVVLALLGELGFALLVVLALLLGCRSVLYEVGYQSYLPSVVPPERLELANSRLQSTESVALLAGAGLTGQLFGVRTGLAAGCVGVVGSMVWTLGPGGALLRRGVRIDVPQDAPGGSGTVS